MVLKTYVNFRCRYVKSDLLHERVQKMPRVKTRLANSEKRKGLVECAIDSCKRVFKENEMKYLSIKLVRRSNIEQNTGRTNLLLISGE